MKTAKAFGKNLPISTKHSVEICNFIRYKSVEKVIGMLRKVIEKKMAVPFKRYNRDVGHRRGVGSARYPEKASKYFIKLIEQAMANAKVIGLDMSKLIISKAVANKGPRVWHFGRFRRRKMKRTHLEIVVKEKND